MSFFSRLGHDLKKVAVVSGKGAVKGIGYAVTVGEIIDPQLFDPIAAVLQLVHGENNTMNPLEQFAITMILATLQSTVKNPQHKAAVKNQMLLVASDIMLAYGIVPPPEANPAMFPAVDSPKPPAAGA